MSENPRARMGFWDFCHQHPIAMVFAIIFLACGLESAASAITGHWNDDTFWKYNGSCKEAPP
jgi:hypothetical protein